MAASADDGAPRESTAALVTRGRGAMASEKMSDAEGTAKRSTSARGGEFRTRHRAEIDLDPDPDLALDPRSFGSERSRQRKASCRTRRYPTPSTAAHPLSAAVNGRTDLVRPR